jgi:hypothetical protein
LCNRDKDIAPITAEGEIFSREEIGKDVKESLHNFRRVLYLDNEDGGDNEDVLHASNAAWARLSTLFCDRESFSREYLSDISEGAEETILGQLLSWLKFIEWPVGMVDCCLWSETADTPTKLHEQINRRMKDKFWPLVKVIR